MTGALVSLLVLGTVGAAGVALLERTIRRTSFGFALLAATVVVDTLLHEVEVQAQVGPFAVYPNDVAFGLLGAAAVARLLRSDRVDPLQVLVLVFLGVSIWSAARGIPIHGGGAALNEARKNLLYGCAVLYFSTEAGDGERSDRFLSWWVGLGTYLLAVAALRWGAFFGGVTVLLPDPGTLRVLNSFETLIPLTGLLLAVGLFGRADRGGAPAPGRPPVRYELFVVASFLAVVLLQHRTLWIALIVGLTLLAARDPRLTGRLVVTTVVAGAVVSVALIAVLGQGVERIVTDNLASSATEVGTFEWRVEGWSQLLETSAPDSAEEVLLGQPFGGGFDRYVDGHRVTVSPHNYLLESYLRVGLVGLLAFVALHVALIVRLYPSRRWTGRLRHDAIGVAVVVLVLYYLTSHPVPEHGAFTGAAMAIAMRRGVRSTEPSPRPAPTRTLVVAR